MKEKKNNYYDPKEEKLNVITHGFGLLMSFVALILLLKKAINYDTIYLISFCVFGFSLILLYAASTLFHSSKKQKQRNRFQIFDHAAIYILIAGTYTPFTLLILDGWVGWTIFGVSWGLAFVGIILKLFFTGKYDRASTFAYVFMGWLIVFAVKPLIINLSFEGLMWLLAGGVSYTVGAVLYSIEKIKYNHAIFHIFVLLGSFAHFMAVYYYISPK